MESDKFYEDINKKYNGQYLTILNDLLQVQENTSLLESKIETLAALKLLQGQVEKNEKKDHYGNVYHFYYVSIPMLDIIEVMAQDVPLDWLFYVLKSLGKKGIKKIYKRGWSNYTMYGNIWYKNDTLFIEYIPDTEKLYNKEINQLYTKLYAPILLSFQTVEGLYLYKLLKSYAYIIEQNDHVIIELSLYFELNDLIVMLGFIDKKQADDKRKKIKSIFISGGADQGLLYNNWDSFRMKVLEPGIKEINRLSDLYVSRFEPKTGDDKDEEIVGVTISVQGNKDYKPFC